MRERSRLDALDRTRRMNFAMLERYSAYMNFNPRGVCAQLVQGIMSDYGLSEQRAFCVALMSAMGMNPSENETDAYLAKHYILPYVKKRDTSQFLSDPYYQNIKIPARTLGDWEFKQQELAPYEAFVCGEELVLPDLTEVPQICFFSQTYRYPAVLQGGVEWMTLAPNETETTRRAVERAEGRVLTLGLGLGYFAYMASQKQSVPDVTVVERDECVISLFREHILPQFPRGEKLRVIHEDAFEYLSHMQDGEYDFVFADIWHDPSDGVEAYMKLKSLQKKLPSTRFEYWLEPTLLSHLRWRSFFAIQKSVADTSHVGEGRCIKTFEEIARYLENNNLSTIAPDIFL